MSVVLEFSPVLSRGDFEKLKWSPFKRQDVEYIIAALTLPCGKRFQTFGSLWNGTRIDIHEMKDRLMNGLVSSAICSVDPYGNKPDERRRMEELLSCVSLSEAITHESPSVMMARSIDG